MRFFSRSARPWSIPRDSATLISLWRQSRPAVTSQPFPQSPQRRRWETFIQFWLAVDWKIEKKNWNHFDRLAGCNRFPVLSTTIANVVSHVVLSKAFNDGWEFTVTHPTHEKHYGSGGEAPVVPPWQQSYIQPQWTFSGQRDHYSISY